MKVVYIAGKFRGKTARHVAENVRAAERVGFQVAAAGAMPLIPHANTSNFDGTLTGQFWIDGTMELLRRVDAVMMVEGWSESQGAVAEEREAQRLGLPVFVPNDYDALRAWLATPSPETGAPPHHPRPTPPAPYHDAGTCDVCDGRRSGKPPFGGGAPAAEPGKPATCEGCGDTIAECDELASRGTIGCTGNNRRRTCCACNGTGRATPEKGARR